MIFSTQLGPRKRIFRLIQLMERKINFSNQYIRMKSRELGWNWKGNKQGHKNKQIPEACLKQVNKESAGKKKRKGIRTT